MCDVCEADNSDYTMKCGTKSTLVQRSLYRVFVDRPAKISVCRVHDIELFVSGETKFLNNNRPFLNKLSERKGRY